MPPKIAVLGTGANGAGIGSPVWLVAWSVSSTIAIVRVARSAAA